MLARAWQQCLCSRGHEIECAAEMPSSFLGGWAPKGVQVVGCCEAGFWQSPFEVAGSRQLMLAICACYLC
jgi:hypothetical protein